MAPRVLHIPHPVLSRPATALEDIDRHAVELGHALLDTMRSSSHSVGVAAPQIGVSLRAFCLDVTGHRRARSCHGELVLFNPVIIEHSGSEIGREGCMSVPDLTGDVARATAMIVEGLGLDGEKRRFEVDAFEARAMQHEIDHLDGLVFVDRVVAPGRVFPRRVYRAE
ncbi:MAG: peptide deformylase [Acidimicrobiales bacterium]